ncbi:MAG: glucoamylase family protein [Patescibacteria group bacterium]|jgi:hypothetical protein
MAVEMLRQTTGVVAQERPEFASLPEILPQRELLDRYSLSTWRSIERLTIPETGLIADNINEHEEITMYTSPTNIGLSLMGVVVARERGIISGQEAKYRLIHTLKTLGKMEKCHGFLCNWYDPETGGVLSRWPANGNLLNPFVSSVDNGWLAAGLMVVREAESDCAETANKLLNDMDFSFFYNQNLGLLHGVYRPTSETFEAWCYAILNTEARMASYIGIAQKQLPAEHYFRLFRTFLPGHKQKQIPRGHFERYLGVEVYEGNYVDKDGVSVVPSWGGSMFEALMPTLLVPEEEWGPTSWGINHQRYVQAQVNHGASCHDGWFGYSPCCDPEGGYREFGLWSLGSFCDGYPCGSKYNPICNERVITPHALFLAAKYAPNESLWVLTDLERAYPEIYSSNGFFDAINTSGRVAKTQLALDQLLSFLSGGNELRAFFAPQVEAELRPLMEMEAFNL